MEVVDVNALFGGTKPKLVGGADNPSAFDPATGQPGSEAIRVVVASGAFVGITAIGNRRSPEFAAPHDKGAVQQAVRF
jgi:hypothetical protein